MGMAREVCGVDYWELGLVLVLRGGFLMDFYIG